MLLAGFYLERQHYYGYPNSWKEKQILINNQIGQHLIKSCFIY
jgi:hypothetical protein